MPCYAYQGIRPVIDPTSYLHPLASLIGDVIIGPGCFIAPGASLRADFGRIVVEGDSSIQDSVTIHSNALGDTIIKRGCTIGHGAVIHGCVIGENTLVGILSIILDEANIGPENLIAAASLVKSNTITPARSMLSGRPARVVRTFAEDEITWKNNGNGEYQRLAREALSDFIEVEPLTAPESNRKRLRSDAIPLRLGGQVAITRRERAYPSSSQEVNHGNL